MNEKTLKKFLVGAKCVQVMLYPNTLHVRFDNGAMLAVHGVTGDGIDVDIIGPSPEVPCWLEEET